MLGIWGPPAAEGARHWPSVLAELKNRGVRDVFFPVRDGLKGLPDAVGVVWPEAVVQMCIIHLMRNTFRHAPKADWGAIGYDCVCSIESGPCERVESLQMSGRF